MQKKQDDEGHELIRKAVFVVLAILLVVVFGSFITGAFTFVFDNAEGASYNITGECDINADSADCCESACAQWCAEKGKKVLKIGVISPMETKCQCTCSI